MEFPNEEIKVEDPWYEYGTFDFEISPINGEKYFARCRLAAWRVERALFVDRAENCPSLNDALFEGIIEYRLNKGYWLCDQETLSPLRECLDEFYA